MDFALNQKTASRLDFAGSLDLAAGRRAISNVNGAEGRAARL